MSIVFCILISAFLMMVMDWKQPPRVLLRSSDGSMLLVRARGDVAEARHALPWTMCE